jgi:hypothetical protein
MNEPVREYGLQVLRLRKELKQAEAMVKARPRVARPVTGPHARGLPSSPKERAAEMIRMRLLTAEMQYHELGGSEQLLRELLADGGW